MVNSVSVQIQRANNDAISNQVLPQNQNLIKIGVIFGPRNRRLSPKVREVERPRMV